MVPHPGTKKGTDQLRPLNLPKPIDVQTKGDVPAMLIEGKRRSKVTQVQDVWRIDDEWWRNPISRRYYQLVLEDGTLRTVYHDLITNSWHEQAY